MFRSKDNVNSVTSEESYNILHFLVASVYGHWSESAQRYSYMPVSGKIVDSPNRGNK